MYIEVYNSTIPIFRLKKQVTMKLLEVEQSSECTTVLGLDTKT
jgi:hypothetical protein